MNRSFNPGFSEGLPPGGYLRLPQRPLTNTVIALADLLYLEALSNYTWFYLRDGKRLLMANTLKYYLAKLPLTHFIQAHRKYVINVYHVARIEREISDTGGVAYLRTGAVLAVSRRRWLSLERLLIQHRDSLAKRP